MERGRPRKYKTVDKLNEAIDNFFANRDKEEKPYTITGLAYALGFDSRQSIYDYIDRNDDFSYIVKRATLFIEDTVEQRLFGNNSSGSMFWLKNRGWRDTYHNEMNATVATPQIINDAPND